jgi:hypothetical protein
VKTGRDMESIAASTKDVWISDRAKKADKAPKRAPAKKAVAKKAQKKSPKKKSQPSSSRSSPRASTSRPRATAGSMR